MPYGITLTDTSILDKVMGVIPSLISLGATCFEALVDNPVTLVYVGVGFISVGFGIWRKMSRSAKRG